VIRSKRTKPRRIRFADAGAKNTVVNGVMTFPCGREVCLLETMAGRREYKERTRAMAMRQKFVSPISGDLMNAWDATFDHQDGRGAGGAHRDDRIEIDGEWHNAALTLKDNTEKGSRRYHWVNGSYIPVERTEPKA
jgi:hypothetical protein